MIDELDPPEHAPVASPERAVLDARFATVGELELAPFSGMRAVIAQALGFRYPFIGPDALEQFHATGVYPGAVRDVAIYFWVRAAGDRERLQKAYWRPAEALDAAVEWAQERDMCDVTAEPFKEAFRLMMKLQSDAHEAQPVPESGGGTTPPKQ
jgi:hypothetical protein